MRTRAHARYRLVQWISAQLPPAAAFWVAERIADAQWRRSSRDRKAVEDNFALIMPTTGAPPAAAVRQVFRNFGRYLIELFSAHRLSQARVIVEGEPHLRQAQALGRGVIVLTAHAGNWELAGMMVRRLGFPITAVALPHDDPAVNRLFDEARARAGVGVIALGPGAWRRSLEVLRQGGVLGLLGDREFTGHGVTVPLCSAFATFPAGPALLSLRTQAPIVPIFLMREGRWAFRFCIEPPIRPPTGQSSAAAIKSITRAYAQVFETYLRRWPEQWLVFQRISNDECRMTNAEAMHSTFDMQSSALSR